MAFKLILTAFFSSWKKQQKNLQLLNLRYIFLCNYNDINYSYAAINCNKMNASYVGEAWDTSKPEFLFRSD